MKVLMTADTAGGVWTYSLELARAFDDYGVEVVLATMGAIPTAEQRAQVESIPNIDLRVSDYKLEWMDDPWQDVAYAGKWLLRLAGQVRPDVVHLNSYVHGALRWPVPALIVGHSCTLSRWDACNPKPAPSSLDRYSHLVARGLHAVPLVVAPTRAMLSVLERHYGYFQCVRVIPSSRDPSQFVPAEKAPIVFTASRIWNEAKNLAVLEKAAPRLDWPLYVAGDTDGTGRSRPEQPNVRFLGQFAPQAIPAWFSRAAIYVLPARYEPFGFSVIEAALAGCALVLGDIPTLREVWYDSAVFVPPDDTDALVYAIHRLTTDGEYRAAMASKARDCALQFSPKKMAESYLSAYQNLAINLTLCGRQPIDSARMPGLEHGEAQRSGAQTWAPDHMVTQLVSAAPIGVDR